MPNSLLELNYTLASGTVPTTGVIVTWNKTLTNTIFYGISGSGNNSFATMYLDTADPLGNFGYTVDSVTLSGSGLNTNIATFSTPLTQLRGIISGCSGCSNIWIYADTSY